MFIGMCVVQPRDLRRHRAVQVERQVGNAPLGLQTQDGTQDGLRSTDANAGISVVPPRAAARDVVAQRVILLKPLGQVAAQRLASESTALPTEDPLMSDDLGSDAEYHMRLLVDRVPTMLAYWDRNLICRFANRAYEAWFGVDPDRLLGTHIKDLLGPKLFEMNLPYMTKALSGERQVFERIIPGPGGIERHSLAEYIPDSVDGAVRGFLVQVTNVTELKETQAALRRETELRGQIEEHATQLQTLLQERTEMLNVLAHEVRQPLNNASAALQAAEKSCAREGDIFASGQVVQAQQVLREVMLRIDNTLTVASLLARPDPIERDDADIDVLIAIAIADMPAAERARINVTRETPTRTALMDMSLLRLALRNLLSNALKFSPPGSMVTVHITDSEEPPALHIAVTDTGPGIPPALLPRLFTRGARAKSNAHPDGLGLGLYIVERVMSLHGGSVEVAHTGRDGTTMKLVIAQGDNEGHALYRADS